MPNLTTPPSSDPNWIIANPGNGVEPTGSLKNAGYATNQRPTFQNFNWLFYNVTLWIRWFYLSITTLNNAAIFYDASIGTGGTYADINAAMADSGLPVGSTLLILNSLALTSTQQITKNNTSIVLKPGVVLSNSGAGTGIRVSATRCRIKGGKMSGFSVSAITVDSGGSADFAMIGEMLFASNTADVTDSSGKASQYALQSET